MSFFSAIRRAFGFDYSDDDEVTADDITDELVSKEPEAEQAVPVQEETPAVEGLSELPTLPGIEPEVKAKIFEGVVSVFNQALPDFLSRSVNPEAQQRILSEALDKSIDDYLNGLMVKAEQYAESKLKASSEASRREAERLKNEMASLEQQRTKLREQQLSADRRRRALADRVSDLEAQLAAADAEREQYQLENKSLLNKLKVADIQPGVVEDLTRQIEELKAAKDGGENSSDATVAVDFEELGKLKESNTLLSEELEGLKSEIGQLRDNLLTAETSANDIKAERDKLQLALDNHNEQQSMSQAMYNDMQEKYAAERSRRLELEKELEETAGIVADVQKTQAQLEQVATIIAKRDERIERLKATNKKLRDEISKLKECVSAGAFGGLFDMPDQMPPKMPTDAQKAEMAALEDDFECPDWFVSEPPPGENPLRTEDVAFGYQEPPKKPRKPDNDAQLSLF